MRDYQESQKEPLESRTGRDYPYHEKWRIFSPGNCRTYEPYQENNLSNSEEAVHHPKHYNSDPSGVECIQVTEHRNFCVGNAIKYLWRAGLKGPEGDSSKHIEDLKKAIWYTNREIERLGKLGT